MIIDLTVPLNTQTPIFPGDPSLDIKPVDNFEDNGYLGHSINMGTHTGTHIDAPAHMLEGSRTLDTFPAESFIGRCMYVAIENNIFDLESVQNADIQEGDIVVFSTRMSDLSHEPAYFNDYPAMSSEIAEYLVSQNVKMVGVDACSIDNLPDFPIHKILLGGNVLIIENLTNTEKLANVEAKIYALPLKFDLDGAPARVIAEVQ